MSSVPAEAALSGHEKLPSTKGRALLLTTLIDCAGVTRGKVIPVERMESAARSGVGASPSWCLFCVDNHIAWIPSITAVGDHRLKPDLSAAVRIAPDLTWAPAEVWQQDDERGFWCARNVLRQQVDALSRRGISVKSAGEMEFFLLPVEAAAQSPWLAYGAGAVLDREAFIADVAEQFTHCGLGLEQFHAEYGTQQYELSLAPADPVAAMDKLALARIILGRIGRKYGLRVSYSPMPFAGGAGNGGHVHFSFTDNGRPLLAGSDGPHGIGRDGQAMIGGIIHYLPEMLGLLTPSIISGARLKPGLWSGAFACWGQENREAAVRYCEANQSNPHGAHIEVKCIDPSANPYLACASVLAMAAAGLQEMRELPAETFDDPRQLSEAQRAARGIVQLSSDHDLVLRQLEASPLARAMLDPQMLAALIAVRRHEAEAYQTKTPDQIAAALRFAWSV